LRRKDEKNKYISAIKSLQQEILLKLNKQEFSFQEPKIIPIPKDLPGGIYRPIAQFEILDKLIIKLTNNYFTDLFDPFFHDVSYAFRSSCNKKNHHEAFREIVKYNKDHKDVDLWVSECDIKKFYDTVNHSVIKKEFKKLKKKVFNNPALNQYFSSDAERIFYKYLDSYAFNKTIKRKNAQIEYWEKVKGSSKKKEFGWIEPHDLKQHYKRIGSARIGVPQGGALSGLIANIVLNAVDDKICQEKNYDKELLYLRFCDDIVIIHPNESRCNQFFDIYCHSLKQLRLFPHPPSDLSKGYTYEFWGGKTKLNYCWSEKPKQFPWIGFVGYEINRKGHVRVRKGSIKKEILKQRKWVNDVITIFSYESVSDISKVELMVIGRLIGMSVGRFGVYNYSIIENDMCWINGFKCIDDNPYIRMQLRKLDRERNKQIWRLKKKLPILKFEENTSVKDESKCRNTRQIKEHIGKPFSYYYHGLK